ncbi:MAG: isoprenylcysteine carboxylmethyltransferase family protein [Nitrospinota bacterium]
MEGRSPDVPRVIARPPVIHFGLIAAAALFSLVRPSPSLLGGGGRWAGWAAMAAGAWLMGAALIQFQRAGTPHETDKPAAAFVTGGLYRFSRNPMYLSLFLFHAGIGGAAGSLWILLSLLPAFLLVRFGVIAPEERYLERRFGADYLRYKAAVRRWI